MRAVCRAAAAVCGMTPTRARRTHLRGLRLGSLKGSRFGLPSASSSPTVHSIWTACVWSASAAMPCYGCVSATRSVHAASLSHSCCLRRDVLRAAVCCHVRVLQCVVMNACSHPLTHHAVQIEVSHCRAGRPHINRGFIWCALKNGRKRELKSGHTFGCVIQHPQLVESAR